MRRLVRPLVLLAVLALGVVAWLAWQARPRTVEVAAATLGPAVEAVYATGAVEPVHWARVGPAARARLRAVLVEDGSASRRASRSPGSTTRHARLLADEAEARARFAAEADPQHPRRARHRRPRHVERAEQRRPRARAAAEARRRLNDFVCTRPPTASCCAATSRWARWWTPPPPVLDRRAAAVARHRRGRRGGHARIARGQRVCCAPTPSPAASCRPSWRRSRPRATPPAKTYRVRLALPDDTPLLIGMTVEANIVLRETRTPCWCRPALALRERRGAARARRRPGDPPRQIGSPSRARELAEVAVGCRGRAPSIVDPPPRPPPSGHRGPRRDRGAARSGRSARPWPGRRLTGDAAAPRPRPAASPPPRAADAGLGVGRGARRRLLHRDHALMRGFQDLLRQPRSSTSRRTSWSRTSSRRPPPQPALPLRRGARSLVHGVKPKTAAAASAPPAPSSRARGDARASSPRRRCRARRSCATARATSARSRSTGIDPQRDAAGDPTSSRT